MSNDPRYILSEADYEVAMATVARLWGAKCGTPDGDRLNHLVTLIDAYETIAYPMGSPPGVPRKPIAST